MQNKEGRRVKVRDQRKCVRSFSVLEDAHRSRRGSALRVNAHRWGKGKGKYGWVMG